MNKDLIINHVIEITSSAGIAIAVAVFALWMSARISRRIRRLPERFSNFDPMFASFLSSFARYSILVLAATFVLSRLGIQATSLAAVIGAASLAIGLALQGTLSNMASGLMIVMFRPFQVGNTITAGAHSGAVTGITLFYTELTTPENTQIIVPNSDLWSKAIINSSAYDTRRVDLVFTVSDTNDLERVEEVIRTAISHDRRIIEDNPLFVKLTAISVGRLDFTMRVWVASADFSDFRLDALRRVKDAFMINGVDMPAPTVTVT